MESETYKRSRLYLCRFNLLHEMTKLSKDIPPHMLKPDWYIERYRRESALPLEFHRRRLIHDSEDDDIIPRRRGELVSRLNRKPRHLSRAEVLSLFASHAQWLVRDQKKVKFQSTRVINVEAWEAWLPKIRRWRAISKRDWAGSGDVFGKFDPDDDSDIEILANSEPEDEDPEQGTYQAPPPPPPQPPAPPPMEVEIFEIPESEPDEESPPPTRHTRKRRRITSVGSSPSRDTRTDSCEYCGRRRKRSSSSHSFVAAAQTTPCHHIML